MERHPASTTSTTSTTDSGARSGEGGDVPPVQVASAPTRLDRLCVTEGAAIPTGGRLLIESPKFRAVSARSTDAAAQLRFDYLGPTAESAALGSGRVRRQIGLKLRAQDGCNLVYVMWRIEPVSELSVQVKRNPGLRAFAECRNGGYRNVGQTRFRRGTARWGATSSPSTGPSVCGATMAVFPSHSPRERAGARRERQAHAPPGSTTEARLLARASVGGSG
jgi:hypothetical protein